jgi:ribonucleoside-diphosphate reductase alpha chain
MDAFGTAISLCLQYGVPVCELCRKFAHSRFEPSGFTKNPDIPMAKSLVDYIFRWLNLTFPNGVLAGMESSTVSDEIVTVESGAGDSDTVTEPVMTGGAVVDSGHSHDSGTGERIDKQFDHFMDDAPACDLCGAITVRNGACYRCYNCGNSMGCS